MLASGIDGGDEQGNAVQFRLVDETCSFLTVEGRRRSACFQRLTTSMCPFNEFTESWGTINRENGWGRVCTTPLIVAGVFLFWTASWRKSTNCRIKRYKLKLDQKTQQQQQSPASCLHAKPQSHNSVVVWESNRQPADVRPKSQKKKLNA